MLSVKNVSIVRVERKKFIFQNLPLDKSHFITGEWNKTLYAVSGNTYTLTAEVDNKRGRVSDTLVWTVGDAKVASVKAAAGTYCITLTGLKPGKTTLEVKSKLLGNKVIARYDINVGAVKNAWNNAAYYGENEPD